MNDVIEKRKEIGFLFKAEMVKAIAEGKKTMTRRLMTKRNSICSTLLTGDGQGWHSFDFNDVVIDGKESNYGYLKVAVPENETRHRIFSRLSPGDLIYVKETYCEEVVRDESEIGYLYAAEYEDKSFAKWKPSLFMPKKAARFWLEVAEVRPERLCDISDGDVAREGVSWNERLEFGRDKRNCSSPAQRSFRSLWDKINGEEHWNTNPFVWAYTFKVR
jgi:hypothetical protein